jgi:D-alanyl-D-alanine carboxypeptidase
MVFALFAVVVVLLIAGLSALLSEGLGGAGIQTEWGATLAKAGAASLSAADPSAGQSEEPGQGQSGEQGQEQHEEQDAAKQPPKPANSASTFAGFWYYEAGREGRYRTFQEAHPELAASDVVWMVDANLDKPVYAETVETPDPGSMLALVSKHFSLPENYIPDDLVYVGHTQLRAEAAGALNEMISAAQADGHILWSQSGFRPFSMQAELHGAYAAQDGIETADRYSARPGFSEHQTGLVTDLNDITAAFGSRAEGQWVASHAHEYGFIVRYTNENANITAYIPEPWHIRYIGIQAANTMREQGISSFEEYWVKYVRHTPPTNQS